MPKKGSESLTAGSACHEADRRIVRSLRILAVVDGSERTNRIVDFVVAVAQNSGAMEVIILNVQDRHFDARLRGYQNFKKNEIEDRLINELGTPVVNSVNNWLQKAGIVARSKVRIGDPVPVILRCAAEDDCDVIVIGESRLQGFRHWLFATMGMRLPSSLALRLIATAQMPVVVVK
jgi:nucleotide-binding universal stress UspA family protein